MRKRRVQALLLALLATTACGVRPTGTIYGSQGPADTPDGTILYFASGETLTRVIRPGEEQQEDILSTLAEGPLAVERAAGLTTEVPPEVLPITRGTTNGTVEIKVSVPAASLTEMAQNQLICTALRWDDPTQKTSITLTGPDKSLPPKTCPFTP